jgi:predicted HTH domain antitoxin
MNYEALAGRARYFKEEGGADSMRNLWEEDKAEAVQEELKKTAVKLIQRGKDTVEEIADITGLPLDTVRELEKQTMQPV